MSMSTLVRVKNNRFAPMCTKAAKSILINSCNCNNSITSKIWYQRLSVGNHINDVTNRCMLRVIINNRYNVTPTID